MAAISECNFLSVWVTELDTMHKEILRSDN